MRCSSSNQFSTIQHFGWLDNDAGGDITVKDWSTLGETMVNDNWGVFALRLRGAKRAPEILWNYRKNVAEISSPVVHDGVFYMVHDGILTSLDAETGELLKRGRIGQGSSKVYASPVAADGKLYVATLDGEVVILRAGGEWEKLATVDLDDEIWASPAIADGQLFLRTRNKLYRFGAAER